MGTFWKKSGSRRITMTTGLLAFALVCLITLVMFSQPVKAEPASQSIPVTPGVFGHGAEDWRDADLGDGTGVKVGIVDTGFMGFEDLPDAEAPGPYTHRVEFKCFFENAAGKVVTTQTNFTKCESKSSHGTRVAEVLLDVAPDVKLYITNPPDSGELRKAVDWLVGKNVDIANRVNFVGAKTVY